MGVDDYRDREGDAEERTGLGQGEGVDGDEDPAGVDDFSDDASLGGDTSSG
jgi:hypothetical protein